MLFLHADLQLLMVAVYEAAEVRGVAFYGSQWPSEKTKVG